MNDEQKTDLLDRLIADPPRRATILDESRATPDERAELLELATLADAAWLSTRGAPPVESDPIAAMLGVAPTPGLTIDPRRLKQARIRSRIGVPQLRDKLTARGWDVSTADVGSWQTREGIELVPALLQDIGEALNVSADEFTVVRSGQSSNIHTVLRGTDWFQALVSQWQALSNVARSVAEAQLLSRATATAHRGEEPDLEQIRELLEHLVAARTEHGERQP